MELMSPAHASGQDGHQDPLTCVASNQDGSLIMTGSVDCQAKLVNSATGKVGPCGRGQSQEPWGTALPGPCLGPGRCPRVVQGSAGFKQPVVATGGQQEAPLANTTASSRLLVGPGAGWSHSKEVPPLFALKS